MNESVPFMLELANGPIFRFALAIMLLGTVRAVAFGASDTIAAYLTTEDRAIFRRKLRMRLLWELFPSTVLHEARSGIGPAMQMYHATLFLISLVFRVTAVLAPVFMAEHIVLLQRGSGVYWPALPMAVVDGLTVIVIVTGAAIFLGRLYSRTVRSIDPPWSFAKPLLLTIPFVTGLLARHPAWSPIDYHVVMLFHALSASVLLVMVPFGRLLACMHTPLTKVMPDMAWDAPGNATPAKPSAAPL